MGEAIREQKIVNKFGGCNAGKDYEPNYNLADELFLGVLSHLVINQSA